MSRFGRHYQIARPTGVCAATGDALDAGDACIATLAERPEDEGLIRQDYSLAAWERGGRPEGLFSFWRTVVPRPEEKRRPLVDDRVLIDLFERLADDDRPARRAFRFVLALILMRKRLLRFERRVRIGDEDRWILRPRGAEEGTPPYEVPDPRLSDDDVHELTEQLGEILQSELG